MKYLFLCFLILGCSTTYKRIGIVHDYVFNNATKACRNHDGLHYIVQNDKIYEKGKREEYPCSTSNIFRCQDGTMINFDPGIGYCFIDEMQLTETLENK